MLAREDLRVPPGAPLLDALRSAMHTRSEVEYQTHRQLASADTVRYVRNTAAVLSIARQLASDCTAPGAVALAADWLASAGQRLLLRMAD